MKCAGSRFWRSFRKTGDPALTRRARYRKIVLYPLFHRPQPRRTAMFHILVADDDKHTRMLLRAVLENADYTVTTAADGEEALAILDREHIDLVVLDVMMPKLDGSSKSSIRWQTAILSTISPTNLKRRLSPSRALRSCCAAETSRMRKRRNTSRSSGRSRCGSPRWRSMC